MFKQAFIGLLCCLSCSPLLVHASICNEMSETISKDVDHYSAALATQNLPWMKLSWLQKKLGKAAKIKLSETETQYEWQCPEGDSAVIRAILGTKGQILKLSGQYSSEAGSGLFSIRQNATKTGFEPETFASTGGQTYEAPAKTSARLEIQMRYDLHLPPSEFASCKQAIAAIGDDVVKYSTSLLKGTKLPWMNINALERLVGPNVHPGEPTSVSKKYMRRCKQLSGGEMATIIVLFNNAGDLDGIYGGMSTCRPTWCSFGVMKGEGGKPDTVLTNK